MASSATTPIRSTTGALDYYVPAHCGLVWTAVGLLALPAQLAHYREDGVLRRLHASAAAPGVVLGAQLLVTFLISLAGSALMVAMAALVYDIHAPRSLAGFLGAWLCAAGDHPVLPWRAIGRAGAVLHDDDGLRRGPSPEVVGGAMHWVSNLLPITYMLRLLQDPWLGLAWSLADTALVVAFLLGAALGARLLFRWD